MDARRDGPDGNRRAARRLALRGRQALVPLRAAGVGSDHARTDHPRVGPHWLSRRQPRQHARCGGSEGRRPMLRASLHDRRLVLGDLPPGERPVAPGRRLRARGPRGTRRRPVGVQLLDGRAGGQSARRRGQRRADHRCRQVRPGLQLALGLGGRERAILRARRHRDPCSPFGRG